MRVLLMDRLGHCPPATRLIGSEEEGREHARRSATETRSATAAVQADKNDTSESDTADDEATRRSIGRRVLKLAAFSLAAGCMECAQEILLQLKQATT